MSHRILVVDDEPAITVLLEYNLKLEGYMVECVADGKQAVEAFHRFQPDLILLDLMLPGMNGLEICRHLRQEGHHVPVIMLTAMHDLSDRIAGLDNGADDYMVKPFSPQELMSRIRAVLRRAQMTPSADEERDLQVGEIYISPSRREASFRGEPLELTPKEFELLHYLCKHQGKALSRRQLLHHVWDYSFVGDTRIVDVHISHLRDKLEVNPRDPLYIQTIRSVGYKLTSPSTLPIRSRASSLSHSGLKQAGSFD